MAIVVPVLLVMGLREQTTARAETPVVRPINVVRVTKVVKVQKVVRREPVQAPAR
jgi:hypothetical protein